MAVVDPRYVYEDLLAMPEDGKRRELLEGELLVSPSPNPRHQRVVRNLVRLLGRLQDSGLGEVLPAPLDVVFDRHTVFEPDIMFIRAERLGIVGERNVTGAPDLVVEVLSEGSRDMDLGPKLRTYGRHGVGEYWVVDADAGTMQVFRREGEAFVEVGTVARGGEIAFLGAGFKVDEILA
jgi:Uma2 family endonuclease